LFLIRAIPVTTGQPVKAEVTIPSDTVAGQALQEQILRQLEDLQFGEHDLFGVRLALEEALVNAIKHGNRLDPAKNVRVQWCVDHERVVIEIEDEGEGFDPGDVPDPTADENLERPCGRGIHLMRAFMTSIEYYDRGNRVVLIKAKTIVVEDSCEEAPSEESETPEGET
jgi:serine/threonine-protein kinase RsbW